MSLVTCLFWIFFVLTLGGLAATLTTGRLRKRHLHLRLAPATIALLVMTIVFAELMAKSRVFPEHEMGIHLVFAKSAGLLVLPVIASGLLLRRRPAWRRVHQVCVTLFVLGALCATATGIWVYSLSRPV